MRNISVLMQIFVPDKANILLDQMDVCLHRRAINSIKQPYISEKNISKPYIVFEKLSKK